MKRQLLAVALASLFALPAFAMDRDEPYDDANYAPSASASASQPRDALVADQVEPDAAREERAEALPSRAGETVLEPGRSIN